MVKFYIFSKGNKMENPTTVRFLIEHDNLVDVPYPLIEMMNLTNHEIGIK